MNKKKLLLRRVRVEEELEESNKDVDEETEEETDVRGRR